MEMFEIQNLEGKIFGFIQDNTFVVHYLSCQPAVDHSLNCLTLVTYNATSKIATLSRAADKNNHVFAVVY
jgi:hypothetical protein